MTHEDALLLINQLQEIDKTHDLYHVRHRFPDRDGGVQMSDLGMEWAEIECLKDEVKRVTLERDAVRSELERVRIWLTLSHGFSHPEITRTKNATVAYAKASEKQMKELLELARPYVDGLLADRIDAALKGCSDE